jgi:hypothetical protein
MCHLVLTETAASFPCFETFAVNCGSWLALLFHQIQRPLQLQFQLHAFLQIQLVSST